MGRRRGRRLCRLRPLGPVYRLWRATGTLFCRTVALFITGPVAGVFTPFIRSLTLVTRVLSLAVFGTLTFTFWASTGRPCAFTGSPCAFTGRACASTGAPAGSAFAPRGFCNFRRISKRFTGLGFCPGSGACGRGKAPRSGSGEWPRLGRPGGRGGAEDWLGGCKTLPRSGSPGILGLGVRPGGPGDWPGRCGSAGSCGRLMLFCCTSGSGVLKNGTGE